MIIGIVKEAVHKKGQIDQKCAINCDIKGHVSNKTFTKYKNVCCEEHFEIHPEVCEIQNRSSHLNRKGLYIRDMIKVTRFQ